MTDHDREAELREALFRSYRYLVEHNLTELASGNVSCRLGDGFLISPTGATGESIRPESFVRIGSDGRAMEPGRASSELPMHLAVYARVPEAISVVHTHSDSCVALACCGMGIPGFHYLVGGFGGDDIPCVPYATFGSEELAEFAAKGLVDRKACLLANHGAICHDTDIERATIRAHRLEILARQYLLARGAGEPRLLSDRNWADHHEMARRLQYG
ncbi:MAG TPA: class II aldolase/adducin family protein [Paracoccaceae bacterium]|nr:class II aldolase/adducin family protein [Paracoccaceae bacterium]